MHFGYTVRPIEEWPGELTRGRRQSTFRAPWSRTKRDLNDELRRLDARSVVIQLAVDQSDIKVAGDAIKARARMWHPGVIVSFESRHGHLQIACDKFEHLVCNLRAVALGMKDMRRLDRYGITKRGEQYRGWRQLPSSGGNGVTDRDEAIEALADLSGMGRDAVERFPKDAYRQAARKHHPDHGGTAEAMQRVSAAWAVLRGAAG